MIFIVNTTQLKINQSFSSSVTSEEIFHFLLKSRGLTSTSQIEEFLRPPAPTLEFLLKKSALSKTNLQKAKKLLDAHLQKNDDICIFGDYDADGVTATAIMWQATLAYAKSTKSSSRLLPFIPDRHRHGYGLSDKAVTEVISGSAFHLSQFKDFSPKLIITVDTGIVAYAGIQAFQKANIDVLVSDHHQPDDSLPPANVFLHTTATSGAGVAWIFSLFLLGSPALKLLDLATIGVVGDMMLLTGLNRALCVHGLRALSTTKRPGLLAMKKAMGIETKALTTYDISFGLAPRINAAGRIYNPLDALRLLCTNDQTLASNLAKKIEHHNQDRQEYTDQALKQIVSRKISHRAIVLLGNFLEGVIGLVAGKLTELYHRPAIVMSDNGEVIKGSARSVPGVDITSLLRSLKTPFLSLGGHPQAAGFSLAKDQVNNMSKELVALADRTIPPEKLVKTLSVDGLISLEQATKTLAKLISTLEPFGLGNYKPRFLTRDLKVLEDRLLGSEGKHRKLLVEQNGVPREVIWFNSPVPHPITALKELVFSPEINLWRNHESLQLNAQYVKT